MYPADCFKSDFENEKLNILNTFEIHYLLIWYNWNSVNIK